MTLSRNQKVMFWTILLLELCLLLAFVFFRLIDFDEGLYLYYAKLVKEGNLPYADFFYPQMPYLPYAQAIIADSGFCSLFIGRSISAFLGLISSVILFLLVYKLTGDGSSSLIVFFLYSLNGLTVNWHSVVKTLVFSDFFALLSFCCFALYLLSAPNKRKSLVFLSGLFAGIAVAFRLVFIPMPLIEGLLLFILSRGEIPKVKGRHFAYLLLGTMAGSFLAIYLLLKDPSAFVFGNIGYHLIWGNEVIRMTLVRKLFTLAKFVLYPQNLAILIAAALGAMTLVRKTKGSRLNSRDTVVVAALVCGAALVATFFLMSPSQFQYYEQALPYLLIASIPILPRLTGRMGKRKLKAAAAATGYLIFVVPFVAIFILGVRQRDKPFEIKAVRKAVQAIQENSGPGEAIFTLWPGYALLSKRETEPGLEAWRGGVIPLLSPEQITKFKLIDDSRVERMITRKEVSLILKEGRLTPSIDDLIERNYRLAESTGFARFYVVKDHQ